MRKQIWIVVVLILVVACKAYPETVTSVPTVVPKPTMHIGKATLTPISTPTPSPITIGLGEEWKLEDGVTIGFTDLHGEGFGFIYVYPQGYIYEWIDDDLPNVDQYKVLNVRTMVYVAHLLDNGDHLVITIIQEEY